MPQPELLPRDFQGGFLKALREDARANTIVIGAAAMVPLLAMVGGAVDASRFYMAETRMQAACDAGALAARRAMDSKVFKTEHRTLGQNFYDQNFTDGMFGIENGTRSFSGTEDGIVVGKATGDLPTSLMGIFGYDDFAISVDCEADINISNSDIMFVVDVTGSMNCAPNNPGGGSCNNTEASDAKIKALRSAVMTFYDTVKSSTSDQAQVRYGMVPYASNVNVGYALADANPNWMARDAEFQSRWATYTGTGLYEEVGTQVTDIRNRRNEFEVEVIEDTTTNISKNKCKKLRPDSFDGDIQTALGTHQGLNFERNEGNFRYSNYTDNNETVRRGERFWDWDKNGGGKNRTCTGGWTIYEYRADIDFEIIEEQDPIVFDEWVYGKVDTAAPPVGTTAPGAPAGWEAVDLTQLYDSTRTLQVPVGTNGAMTNLTWDGCIEEADTIASQTWDPIPTGALDMNVNLVPSNEAERWRPVINGIAWERRDGNTIAGTGNTNTWRGNVVTRDVRGTERENNNGTIVGQDRPGYSCPRAAFRLTDITRTNLQNYVNSLRGRSNTYHDLGMLWGARFVSENGIFGATNATAPNGDAIARHIVFMTDGILSANREVYGTYGVERWSRRVSGDGEGGTTTAGHRERFQAACRLARQENISVWVVAFGTALSQNLIDCATPGRAFVATSSQDLENKFREIAQRIAALRLTK
ncbi:MAG: Tad domain-containing protein [Pseudomonadota bacterium]